MEKIKDINVRSGNPVRDESIRLLDQVNKFYSQFDDILPPGRFKHDLLRFADLKRREYIGGIVDDKKLSKELGK